MIRLTTESGSVYEVDPDAELYRKAATTGESFVDVFPWKPYLYIEARTYTATERSDFVDIDAGDITPGVQLRFQGWRSWDWLRTSPVVSVEVVE